MATAYRISKQQYARDSDELMSGKGSFLHGGRWHSAGQRAVYLSSSLSLAMLEILVHGVSNKVLLSYCFAKVEFDESLLIAPPISQLPEGWGELTVDPIAAQAFGDYWLQQQGSLLLQVPSVVIPTECNYIVNRDHSEFSRLHIGDIQPLPIDPRLFEV